jgi:hypothetical protein
VQAVGNEIGKGSAMKSKLTGVCALTLVRLPRRRWSVLAWVAVAVAFLGAASSADAQFFTGFTPIDFPGSADTTQLSINDSGQIVGSYTDSSVTHGLHGFLYSGGSYTTIDNPAFSQTMLSGINDRGEIVGFGGVPGGVQQGFLYSGGSFTPIIVPSLPPSSNGTFAKGINNPSEVVGFANVPNGGFLYSGTTFTPINVPSAPHTFPQDINDRGQIVGSYISADFRREHGFVYSGGAFITIDDPAAGDSGTTVIYGLNNRGQFVGNSFVCTAMASSPTLTFPVP